MKSVTNVCITALLLAPLVALCAADPACEETVKKLAAQLDAWQKDSPPVPVIDGVTPEPKSGKR
jgi:hypothetical protein